MASSHDGPPDELDRPLEVDPDDWDPRQVYFLMTGLVIPRPIAWVSSLSADGVRNLAPHSYFQVVSHRPPHVIFSSSQRAGAAKDTLANVQATGEFVVNLVSMDVVEPMNFTSTDFPPDEDEFRWAQLETEPATRVAPPRVAAAKAHLECRVTTTVPVGNATIVVGEVVHISIAPEVWRAGRVDPELLDPVCRLAGTRYARLGEIFQLPRPTWATDVTGTEPGEAMPRLPR